MSPPPAGDLGPRSILLRLASDWRSMLPGSATGILQLMHPGIGAGVAQHSAFFEAPLDRIYRSIPQIWATILAPDADKRGVAIRDLHRSVKGTDEQGRRYHALDAETFWWAHATFTWDIFRSAELFHARSLTARERSQLYEESVTWYRRYGMSLRPVPADYPAFVEKFRHVCDHTLEMTPAAATAISYSPSDVPGGLLGQSMAAKAATIVAGPVAKLLVVGCLPETIRRRHQVNFSSVEQVQFGVLCHAIRQGFRFVPRPINLKTFQHVQRQIGARTRPRRFRPAA